MLDRPVVSVIVPCYNQGRYLDEAVNSVLAQTYPDFEIVVVDDGSTEEKTREILENYRQPKTTIIRTENRGVAAARNTAIERARGTYILPLDADDRIAPTYLSKAVELLDKNENLGIVYCEAEYFGTKEGKWNLPPYKFPDILVNNMIFCSGFFRKSDWEKVGGYNSNLIYGWEDFDFWLSLIESGREVYRIPETLFFYRQKEDSRSKSMTAEHLIESYTRLFFNHPRLYTDNIKEIFSELVTLKMDIFGQLERARNRINELEIHEKELEIDLEAAKNNYLELQEELESERKRLEDRIKSMEDNRFWKMRNSWVNFKKTIGLLDKDYPL